MCGLMRENSMQITIAVCAIRSCLHFNSQGPDYAQEGKNNLALPALRFELELFSSRTGSSFIYHDRSVHPEGLLLSRSTLESENLKDVNGLKPILSTEN